MGRNVKQAIAGRNPDLARAAHPVVAGVIVADQIDHLCQLAGNSRHAGIGTDLDGGYGNEQCPSDVDTIADLQNLESILQARGYDDRDISNIFHGNFLRVLQSGLPPS